MKKYDDLIRRFVNDKEYEIQVFYTKAKNVYLTYDNGVFSLRGAVYNLFGPKFETFLINSIKKQLKKESKNKISNKKEIIEINLITKTLCYFGKKVNFDFNDTLIWIYDNKGNLIDKINKPYKNNNDKVISLIENHMKKILLSIFSKYASEASLLILNKKIEFSYTIKRKKLTWATINTFSNTININADLMHFSEKLIKYVAYHEVAHKIEHNHSKGFWEIVKKFIPDYKESIYKLNNFIID
ncbi:M48 family peptidase [Metamycoplasma phocicerebrale]|uniref:M48 family peptidase n=1 Tax=Metamycoplasma phocicerebrale TaxID=142649 RepID=A0A3Q9VA46_9BACT|nr:M48 family metallopeptidase [Metamycoplasma phocicerebrale]AZZ65414.1 M48 family peptidase [Metamycoplasma phocicerebrale]